MGTPSRTLAGVLLIGVVIVAAVIAWDRGGRSPPPASPVDLNEPADFRPQPEPAIDAADLQSERTWSGWPSRWRLDVTARHSGGGVPGAVLSLLVDDQSVELGRTDFDGSWSGEWPEADPPWRVSVTADRHFDKVFRCDADTRRLTLDAEGTISGRVVGALSGDLADGKVEIIAWDFDRLRVRDLADPDRKLSPDYAHAVANADGSFLVRGLHRTRNYTLVAIGPSFGTPAPVVHVPTDDRIVTLEGMPLHGAILRVTGPNGARLLGSPLVVQDHPLSYARPLASHARVASTMDACAWLLGLTAADRDLEADDQRFFFYLPIDDSPVVELQIVRPGYDTWKDEVSIPPATPALAEIPVVLEPWASDFGSIQVELQGLASFGPRQFRADERPDAQLHLIATEHKVLPDGRPLSLTAALPDLGRAPLVVGPLPAGEYTLSLQSGFDLRGPADREQGSSIDVSSGRLARAEFDVSDLGAIQVSITGSTGPYLHQAHVQVSRKGVSTSWIFGSAPYRIPLLPAGQYEIGVSTSPHGMDRRGKLEPSVPIMVYAGRVSLHAYPPFGSR